MSKLVFKERSVTGTILRSINDSLDSLNVSIHLVNSLGVPPDFSELRAIEKCKIDLINVQKDLIGLRDWVDKSTKTYKLVLHEMNKAATLLPKTRIGERKLVVK